MRRYKYLSEVQALSAVAAYEVALMTIVNTLKGDNPAVEIASTALMVVDNIHKERMSPIAIETLLRKVEEMRNDRPDV